MHDHATDGGLAGFLAKASARELRLHLDNAHDYMTSGWTWDSMVERHEELHGVEDARLADIEAAANLLSDRLAAAPAPVVESILCRPLYLSDGNDTLFLAEQVDPRHMPAAGPLYRLTPSPSPDIVAAAKASLAATAAWLAAHKESEGAHLSDSPAGADVRPTGTPAPAGAPLGGES